MTTTRQRDTPPDKEQNSGQDDTVAEPQDRWVREDSPTLDFSPSSTAVDPADAKQDTATEYVTGRFAYTPNATYIGEDLPARSNVARTLNEFNREQDFNSDRTLEPERRMMDLRRDIAGWGHQIGITDTEIKTAITIVMALPTGVRRNFGLETVCLGALTLAANMESPHGGKSIRLDGPSTDTPELVARYEEIRTALGVSEDAVSDFRRWYHRNHS